MKRFYDTGSVLFGKPKPEQYLNSMLLEELGGDTEYLYTTEDGTELMDIITFDVGHVIRVNEHVILIKDPRAAKTVDLDYGIDGVCSRNYGAPLEENLAFDYEPSGGILKEHEYSMRFEHDNWIDTWGDMNKLLHYTHNYDVKVTEYKNADGRPITRFKVHDTMIDNGTGAISELNFTDCFTEYTENGRHYVRFNDRALVTYTEDGINVAELDGRRYVLGSSSGSKQYFCVNDTELTIADELSSRTLWVNDYKVEIDLENRSIAFDGIDLGEGSLDAKTGEPLRALTERRHPKLGTLLYTPEEVPPAPLPAELLPELWISVEHNGVIYRQYKSESLLIVRYNGDEFTEFYDVNDDRVILFNGHEFSLTHRAATAAESENRGIEQITVLFYNGMKYEFA